MINTRLNIIGKWNGKYISHVFLLLFILSIFKSSLLFDLVILTSLLIVVTLRLIHDKNWLKKTDVYVRMASHIPFWSTAIFIVAIVVLGVCYEKWRQNIPFHLSNSRQLILYIAIFIKSMDNHYDAFISSLKSVRDGVYLPERKGQYIEWRDLYRFELTTDSRLLLSSNLGEFSFEIDNRDRDDARILISEWEKNKSKTNRVC